jgi:hypothetical protein
MFRPVRASSILTLVTTLAFAGCGNGCSGSTEEAPAPSHGSTAQTEASGQESPPEMPPHAVDPGPPPELRVTGERARHGREVTIRIENRGAQTRVAGQLVLQRERDGTWATENGVQLDLRFSCHDEAPDCVTLAPGAVYLPPSWLGTIGDSQCLCERCVPAPSGTYRFLVTSCGGAHVIEGEPFDL